MIYDDFDTHYIDMYMGKPKSGKTLIAGSYPKPLLHISIGSDGGSVVLKRMYKDDVEKGNIRFKELTNDLPVNGKIRKTSIEYLAEVLAKLREPEQVQFKTIVIDTVGALQDDYKAYIEFCKNGRALSQQEWGDISKMMLSIKTTMKRFSAQLGTKFVWITHTNEMELYETSGLQKEIRIIPDVTIKTGVKYMKDATNIFYCCRKTIVQDDGKKVVKFLTYVGPHPVMDTGTREMLLETGDFVENFTYDKWQQLISAGTLDSVNLLQDVDQTSAQDADENIEEE